MLHERYLSSIIDPAVTIVSSFAASVKTFGLMPNLYKISEVALNLRSWFSSHFVLSGVEQVKVLADWKWMASWIENQRKIGTLDFS